MAQHRFVWVLISTVVASSAASGILTLTFLIAHLSEKLPRLFGELASVSELEIGLLVMAAASILGVISTIRSLISSLKNARRQIRRTE
jgi:hypothetical protein